VTDGDRTPAPIYQWRPHHTS